MWIDHSPHTHPISIPMGISMGIPIPTAALGIISLSSSLMLQLTHSMRAQTLCVESWHNDR